MSHWTCDQQKKTITNIYLRPIPCITGQSNMNLHCDILRQQRLKQLCPRFL